jgi:hypothetical protein
MLESRLKELQTEIARLKEIDTKITEEVSAEFFERDIVEYHKALGAEPPTMGSFDENGDAMEFNQSNESLIARHNTKLSSEFVSAWTQEDCNEFIEVGCSLQQDMEWANESENLI